MLVPTVLTTTARCSATMHRMQSSLMMINHILSEIATTGLPQRSDPVHWKPKAPCRQCLFGGLRIGMYDPVKQLYVGKDHVGEVPLLTKIAAGLTTGGLAICIASPTDLVKVRMQAEGKLPAGVPKKYPTAMGAYATIARCAIYVMSESCIVYRSTMASLLLNSPCRLHLSLISSKLSQWRPCSDSHFGVSGKMLLRKTLLIVILKEAGDKQRIRALEAFDSEP